VVIVAGFQGVRSIPQETTEGTGSRGGSPNYGQEHGKRYYTDDSEAIARI